ncbi:sigma-54-dependent Fis family transcriptional regulator [Syntrophomonas palmitatica]|uniref:sigma-54-dependent Fis family transcriptional regulator n=1 Tax=Syntrophomonas palmitatica TaxID=402877 RepID=UPI0006CF9C68|nr:sigma-54-dependent Fis family transcriptional regulator [Syntrophomonas palmitatica]
MIVSEIMRRDVCAFNINDSLQRVCYLIEKHRLYGAPVVDDNRILRGLFTRPHLIRALLKQHLFSTPVGELMQTNIVTIEPDRDLSEAIKLFVDTGYHHYPVINDEGVLIGLVLATDLLNALSKECYKLYGVYNFDSRGNAMIGIDEKGYISSVSKTAHEILGDEIEIILGKHVIETVPLMENLGRELLSDARRAQEVSRQLGIAQKRIEYYRTELETIRDSKYTFNEIIGMSPQMKQLRNTASRAAKTSSTVLIQGESGTGKELLAHAIHNASPRCKEPLIKVNCAAIPESLIESELFGYCEGAFTGADKAGKPGKFELADGGSIFLDEVGDLHMNVQAKLLRVLQEFEFERLGGTKTIKVDVRVIAATNQDLMELVKRGKFREDLYYRLNVVTINTPPLRERKEDIAYMTDYLIEKISSRLGIRVGGISDEARRLLINYNFPGNVRELENILERAINFLGEDMGIIKAEHLSLYNSISVRDNIMESTHSGFENVSLAEMVSMAEKSAIIEALERSNGNRNEAARLLKIHRSLLYKKLSKHQIN